MKVTFWGVRGSIPTPGARMARYGGNTSCVEVGLSDGTTLILDAGSGIRELGIEAARDGDISILLTHLHLDHIQGLLFFPPLFDRERTVTVWGPPAFDGALLDRIARYMSAPLSPIEIRELPARVSFETASTSFQLGAARVEAALVSHRGPTLGYRITDGGRTLCYIPDHEPALGQSLDGCGSEWISGFALAHEADLLIHDCQYADAEYPDYLGFGHCAVGDALEFARRAGARRVALFHHDPTHDDERLDELAAEVEERWSGDSGAVTLAREGTTVEAE
jgi:phosphoribosyl 1,2-cyclic phosphodiesterase